MGRASKIEWTHHTFNPWWGCQRVSPGCENCYAEAFAKRTGHKVWGPEPARRFFGDAHWAEPRKWNADALAVGERRRVFCASMADVFEARPDTKSHLALVLARDRLFHLIEETPQLDWLLLTKRPENVERMVPWGGVLGPWPANVWLGVTAEDQQRANERIPLLLSIPARVRFVSYEPALGPVDFTRIVPWQKKGRTGIELAIEFDALRGSCGRTEAEDGPEVRGLQWVIVGGESGPRARHFDIRWARRTLSDCEAAGVACFVKQMGTRPFDGGLEFPVKFHDHKGGLAAEWPERLRVREFPEAHP